MRLHCKSTSESLSLFCEALDKKKEVCVVFCDISKAFDCVWHNGLLFKLRSMGIKGDLLAWFEDYLHIRKQRVILNGISSEWGNIKAGVPQGSVLGPLLFLIYIKDLASTVHSHIRLFADDTSIFIDIDKNIAESADILNADLKAMSEWAKRWLITFSPPKTESLLLSWKTHKRDHPPLVMDNTNITEVESHRHLGLTFSHNLLWSDHIKDIALKANKRVDLMIPLKYTLDRKALEKIYFAFVRPIMEYAGVVWHNCSAQDEQLLETVQKRAARIVSGGIRGTSSDVLYEELCWEKLSVRRERAKLLLFHKIVHNKAPVYLCSLLPTLVGACSRFPLRNRNNYSRFTSMSSTFSRSFFPATVLQWNQLDTNIRNIEDPFAFKGALISNIPKRNLAFYLGSRKVSIIQAQMRMLCSPLKAHLFDKHIIDDSSCACGNVREDNIHFFFTCHLYNAHRRKLHEKISPIAPYNLRVILNGGENLSFVENCSITEAVHEFIEESGRFNI